jgi:hypothetical protein
MSDREDAWDAVHEALPAGWTRANGIDQSD